MRTRTDDQLRAEVLVRIGGGVFCTPTELSRALAEPAARVKEALRSLTESGEAVARCRPRSGGRGGVVTGYHAAR